MDREFYLWRFLRSYDSLGYPPVGNEDDYQLFELYELLYNRYCMDNGIQLDPLRGFDEQVNIEKLSQVLYLELCEILGFPSIINIRRTIWELKTNIDHSVGSEKDYSLYHLGSFAEGFRLETSDLDRMSAFTNQIILHEEDDVADTVISNQNKDVLVTESSQPGHVRLGLITEIAKNPRIDFSQCALEGKMYISSAKFREYDFRHLISPMRENAYVHGPCTAYTGYIEHDIADCLECKSRSKFVQDWIERCKNYAWPSTDTLKDCESTKWHLAPVGVKGSPKENLEWRISFILLEKKLVFSLNHCQFLCLGLLKLFLRDVLNHFAGIKDLLSSYIMKTVLFWEIQKNRDQSWEATNLLEKFSLCLQRLCRYIERENCPNFFIPENNLFQNKMFGVKRRILQYIKSLYQETFHGLYKCDSIDLPYLIFQVKLDDKKYAAMSLDESFFVTQDALDDQFWAELTNVCRFPFKESPINDLKKLHHVLECKQKEDGVSDLEHRALEAWKSEITIYITAHKFKEVTSQKTDVKKFVSLYNSCCDTLRKHDHKGSVALFYLATLMYVTNKYSSCLEVIAESNKRRLKERYLGAIHVSIHLQLPCLLLELESTFFRKFLGIEYSFLHIDPSVYASFLSVLAHHQLKDVEGADNAFQMLREICSGKEGTSLEESSWQLLGICAETLGKYAEAFSSYVKAVMSPRPILTNSAPLLRMLCSIFKILRKRKIY